MYLLYADTNEALRERVHLFDEYFEPMLRKLETFARSGAVPESVYEIPQYLKVCRWPFRQLEYSFALDILNTYLHPGQHYLDAGCGATPLSYVIAATGVEAEACDSDQRLIDDLNQLDMDRVYGAHVTLSCQNLVHTTFADATFDAISCISVLEHIPAPYDQMAIHEMLRLLKPGGLLILTVDYMPPAAHMGNGSFWRYITRAITLLRSGQFAEIGGGVRRKLLAHQVVSDGRALVARSANQCFEISHLEQDILPELQGVEVSSHLPFSHDLRSVTHEQVRHFWEIGELYDPKWFRVVLPAGIIIRTPSTLMDAPA